MYCVRGALCSPGHSCFLNLSLLTFRAPDTNNTPSLDTHLPGHVKHTLHHGHLHLFTFRVAMTKCVGQTTSDPESGQSIDISRILGLFANADLGFCADMEHTQVRFRNVPTKSEIDGTERPMRSE